VIIPPQVKTNGDLSNPDAFSAIKAMFIVFPEPARVKLVRKSIAAKMGRAILMRIGFYPQKLIAMYRWI
jgi:hypothetical protein